MKLYTHEYFKEYLKNKSDKYSLKVCEARIRLYFRSDGDSYGNMAEQLKKCSTEQFSNEDYEKLLEYSQNMLHDMWRQMKLEAGINTKKQDKIHKKMARYSRNRYRSQKTMPTPNERFDTMADVAHSNGSAILEVSFLCKPP